MKWETFSDASYYDMWCVRPVGERNFGHGFHLMNGDEAKGLCELLEAQAAEIKRLRELLAQNIDDEPCWRDHHGYCQAHYLEEDCRVAAARAALGEPTGE